MAPTREERFEGMFRQNYPAVRGYALRRTSADAAQDVVAETFLVAWRRLEDVPVDSLPWLYGVARRVLANRRRSADRRAALEQRLAGADSRDSGRDPGERAGAAELLRTALRRLSEPSREALMLVAWHGLSGARATRRPARRGAGEHSGSPAPAPAERWRRPALPRRPRNTIPMLATSVPVGVLSRPPVRSVRGIRPRRHTLEAVP